VGPYTHFLVIGKNTYLVRFNRSFCDLLGIGCYINVSWKCCLCSVNIMNLAIILLDSDLSTSAQGQGVSNFYLNGKVRIKICNVIHSMLVRFYYGQTAYLHIKIRASCYMSCHNTF
jgi:hypothetical protein